jgi:hypothetical protein
MANNLMLGGGGGTHTSHLLAPGTAVQVRKSHGTPLPVTPTSVTSAEGFSVTHAEVTATGQTDLRVGLNLNTLETPAPGCSAAIGC